MQTILNIIELNGGMDALKEKSIIKVKNDYYMDLVIEYIGKGPNGHDAISVCHYGEQNGDLMRDPEICFEMHETVFRGKVCERLFPYSYQNDYLGLYKGVYITDDQGKVTHIRPRYKKELERFAREWERNLKNQNFLKAARAAA